MASPITLCNNTLPVSGFETTAGATVTMSLQDAPGVTQWSLECIGTDGYHSVDAVNATIDIEPITRTATCIIPDDACGLTFRSVINDGKDINHQLTADYTYEFKVKVLTENQAFELIAQNETTQGNARGWGDAYNENLRKIDAFIPINGGLWEAGGDLSGNLISQQVEKIQNVTVNVDSPTDGYVLTYDLASTSIKFLPVESDYEFIVDGDLSGDNFSQTVIGLQSNPVSDDSPTDGYVLTWDDDAWRPMALPDFPSIPDEFTAGGDLSGDNTSQTVIGIDGNAVNAPSPTDGYVLTWVNGASEWQAKALPSTAGFTAGGDLSGSTSSQTVIRINGATVPASGALTTGNILQVSGSAALSYGPLNLAGGSNYVTGLLPITNIAKGAGYQYLRTDAFATTLEWADLTSLSVGGGANDIQINDGSGNLAAPGNVKSGSGYISIGATPATAGAIRVPYATSGTIIGAKDSGGTDRALLKWVGADQIQIGDGSPHAVWIDGGLANIWGRTSLNMYSGGSGVDTLFADGTQIKMGPPLAGLANPLRFKVATIPCSTFSDYTLSTAQSECPVWIMTDASGGPGSGTMSFIAPAVAGAVVWVINQMSATYVNVKTSGGSNLTHSIDTGHIGMIICDGTNWRNAAEPTT